jgi:hypothetical protein
VVQAPELRIVDDRLWNAVQALRKERAVTKFGPTGKPFRARAVVTRNKHLLSGLLRCAECQGHMITTKVSRGKTYVACSAAHQKDACSHRKGYMVDALEKSVLNGLKHRLGSPEAVKRAAEEYVKEYDALVKKNDTARIDVEKALRRAEFKIDKLVDLATDIDHPVDMGAIKEKLRAAEAERVVLAEQLKLLKATNLPALLRSDFVIDDYKRKVDTVYELLVNDPDSVEGRMGFRSLVERIVVHPTGWGEDYKVSVFGTLSALMGVELFPTMRSDEEILAQEGLSSGSKVNAD